MSDDEGGEMKAAVAKMLLFERTGDLAQRMLLPSLFALHSDGLLPPGMTGLGTGKSDEDDSYRELVRRVISASVPAEVFNRDVAEAFVARSIFSFIEQDGLSWQS